MFSKSGKTDVKCIETPVVSFTSEALMKMKIYTKEVNDEVGWLGTVRKIDERLYMVDDVFLFHQNVHGTTTEITPEGLSEFAEEILKEENGIEKWNNMKLWGHSHVNMGVSPSDQDEKQFEELKKNADFFLRVITNKKGDIKVDVFEGNFIYLNVDIQEETSVEKQRLYELIFQAENQIKEIDENMENTYTELIKSEIKDKVKEKTYGIKSEFRNTYGVEKYSSYGVYGNIYKDYGYEDYNVEKEEICVKTFPANEITYEEVEDYFDETDLYEFAHCLNDKDIRTILSNNGYGSLAWSNREIGIIKDFAQDWLAVYEDKLNKEVK